jgi:hypothetical protein
VRDEELKSIRIGMINDSSFVMEWSEFVVPMELVYDAMQDRSEQ